MIKSTLGLVLPGLKKYKWAIIIVAAITALIGSSRIGYKLAEGKCEESRREALEALIEYQEKIRKENDLLNDQIIEDLRSVETKTEVEIREVIKYVEANPSLNNCKLDASGLQLWNGTAEKD